MSMLYYSFGCGLQPYFMSCVVRETLTNCSIWNNKTCQNFDEGKPIFILYHNEHHLERQLLCLKLIYFHHDFKTITNTTPFKKSIYIFSQALAFYTQRPRKISALLKNSPHIARIKSTTFNRGQRSQFLKSFK
jgi:hypothetical protein